MLRISLFYWTSSDLAPQHKFLLSENLGCMWGSTFKTITLNDSPDISEYENEGRTNKMLGRSQNG